METQMAPLLKMFWFIAIGSSIGFVIQTIMTFMGSDVADGTEADFGGHLVDAHAPFQLLSLRNIINFLLGFGWTGVCFANIITNDGLLVGLAVAVGLLFIAINLYIMYKMMRLEENNSFHISQAVNLTAEVYLAIPENKKGKGKVLLSVKGSVREIDAITEHDKKIATGSIVNIVKTEGNNLLVVKPV